MKLASAAASKTGYAKSVAPFIARHCAEFLALFDPARELSAWALGV